MKVLLAIGLLGLLFAVSSALALDMPKQYQGFIHQAPSNQKSWRQRTLETFNLSTQTRANRSVAMVIGITRYQSLEPLTVNAGDAVELKDYLLASGEFDEVVLLTEQAANEANITWFMLTYFPKLLAKNPGSRFLFNFSGHGEVNPDNDSGYLRLANNKPGEFHDAIGMDRVARWARYTLKKAHHSLFLIDSCVSGLTGLELMGKTRHAKPAQSPQRLLAQRAGWLLTAGEGHQDALAHEDWRGSLFNYALMAGLRGQADAGDGDGVTTSLELFDYIAREVETRSNNQQTPQRYRTFAGGGDFFFAKARASGNPAPDEPLGDTRRMGGKANSAEVPRLLRQCQAHLAANRLKTGAGGNAVDCYSRVIELDPGNAEALQGLEAIKQRYVQLIERAIATHRYAKAETFIERLATLDEWNEAVFELRDRLHKARNGELPGTRIAAARSERAPTSGAAPGNQQPDQELVGEMIAIKKGCFDMGSLLDEEDRDSDERQHRVCLKKDFRIGKTEVSQRQWQAVMGANPARFSDCLDCPVEQVSWHDVQKFLKRLNQRTGGGYRLPTEAEWEYAARAGSRGRSASASRSPPTRSITTPITATAAAPKGFIGTRPCRSAACRPIPGACTRCTATSGNGPARCMTRPMMAQNLRAPRRRIPAVVRCGAGLGPSDRGASVRPPASGPRRMHATSMSDSVWPRIDDPLFFFLFDRSHALRGNACRGAPAPCGLREAGAA